jgi:hypothetical protein
MVRKFKWRHSSGASIDSRPHHAGSLHQATYNVILTHTTCASNTAQLIHHTSPYQEQNIHNVPSKRLRRRDRVQQQDAKQNGHDSAIIRTLNRTEANPRGTTKIHPHQRWTYLHPNLATPALYQCFRGMRQHVKAWSRESGKQTQWQQTPPSTK